MSSGAQEERQRAEEFQMHTQNLTRPDEPEDEAPRTLQYISEPEEMDAPVDALEWANSKSASTANLTEEDVRSSEWVLEYFQLLARMEYPPEYGLTGAARAWAYDDVYEYRMPLKPQDRLKSEGYMEVGKESKTRSKEGWGVETTTRDTKESIVHGKGDNGGGGILGRLRGK